MNSRRDVGGGIDPLPRAEVTIQIAVDIGTTFVLPGRSSTRSGTDIWKRIIEKSDFKTFELPPTFQAAPTPVGWVASIKLRLRDRNSIVTHMQDDPSNCDWLSPGTTEAEFVAFTTGLAFLVIRTELKGTAALDIYDSKIEKWTRGDELPSEPFEEIVQDYSRQFTEVLHNYGCTEFVELKRDSKARLIGSYLVFAVKGQDSFVSKLKPADRHKRKFTLPKDDTCLLLDWNATYIWPFTSESVTDIKKTLLIANVAWFGFVIMDRQLTVVVNGVILSIASKRQGADGRLGAMRLAFLEAADAMRPIRWTRWSPYLDILMLVHRIWETDAQWQSVEERIQWLAAHHQEREAAFREKMNQRLSAFGTVLAIAAIGSVFSDVFELYFFESSVCGFAWWDKHRLLLITAPILLCVCAFIVAIAATVLRFRAGPGGTR